MLDRLNVELLAEHVEVAMTMSLGMGPIAQIARSHLASGGNRTRARLALECGARAALKPHQSISIASVCELLHNASLIHDDLQDNNPLRRGRPSVWKEHGPEYALLTGDLLISAAYQTAAAFGPKACHVIPLIHNAISNTIKGQAFDQSESSVCAFDTCLTIASEKSGPLIALPARMSLVLSGETHDGAARHTGMWIAVAYQILDDIADLAEDIATDAPNACASLQATGMAPDIALGAAVSQAHHALEQARQAATSLPLAIGEPYLTLADLLETKLMEVSDEA